MVIKDLLKFYYKELKSMHTPTSYRGRLASDGSNMVQNAFAEWMKRHKLSIREAATVLGASKGAIASWQKKGAPRYVLLACAAYSMGLKPIE